MSKINMLRKTITEILVRYGGRRTLCRLCTDRGLNDDKLRRQFHRSTVTPFIETRRMWKDELLSVTQQTIWVLCEDRVDTMLYVH